jgi:hypothetical protein
MSSFSLYILLYVAPNDGFTCPAVTTRYLAGKDLSPGPQLGGRAAPPGQVLAGLATAQDLKSLLSISNTMKEPVSPFTFIIDLHFFKAILNGQARSLDNSTYSVF